MQSPPGPRRFFNRRFALRGLRTRPLDFIMEMATRYGDLVGFRDWRDPIFFVNHPELVREVLVTRAQDYVRADTIRNALRLFDGDSILVSEGDQWRQQRRLLQRGFHSERLRHYARTAVEHTQQTVLNWPVAGTIRADVDMAKLCMEILSHVLLGTQPQAKLVESIRIVLDARAIETGNAVSSVHRGTRMVRHERDQALAHVHEFLDDLIQIRRAETAERADLLSMLVSLSQRDVELGKNQRQIDHQIRDETISMINASLDATAAAMSWTSYLVAKHGDVQTRLRQEIQQVETRNSKAGLDHAELPFAEMVIQESLRLHPPNWVLITRRSLHNGSLGGYRIPRGSWLYIFPYVLHRDARWFTEPESFAPDRFAPGDFGPQQRSAYIPLGLGPHVCIGKALSTILLTSILASILREFRLALPSNSTEVEQDARVVMRPRNSLRLLVTRHGTDTSDRKM
jgi:cytochrome P450